MAIVTGAGGGVYGHADEYLGTLASPGLPGVALESLLRVGRS